MLVSPSFRGDNRTVANINGCNLALTGYQQHPMFEERHAHDCPSISLLLKGNYLEEISGSIFNRHPGDLKIVEGGQSHRCYNYSDRTVKLNLEFTSDFFLNAGIRDHLTGNITESHVNKIALIKLYGELCEEPQTVSASAQLLLLQIFNGPVLQPGNKTIPKWVDQLKNFLHDEWDSEFDLNYLSGITGVHPVTISRWFPYYFNMTLSEYLRFIKIEKAIALLNDRHLSLTQIAYACRFADQGHFTRTFKALTGFLPKDFRKI